MRLWSIHPRYLDAKGLVACWREALLAKAVLMGRTRGYRHHPQLQRFQKQSRPVAAINLYLRGLYDEASQRGYSFDAGKLGRTKFLRKIPVTTLQVKFEIEHLKRKLRIRNKRQLKRIRDVKRPLAHPLFRIRKGPLERWEIV